ncbi:MAG: amidohydrolase family protein [Chloroflexota bacterium]|nr:amidohydrolase family protein [Chloroflexota bacterium]
MNLKLRGVRLLGDDQERVGLWDVEVRNGWIHAVLPASPSILASDLPMVDATGAYLLPGLIDLHVHLVWDGGPDPVATLERERREETLLRAVGHARQTLEAGITTVRDLGSVDDLGIDLAEAVERGHVVGPRIIASGRTIIMTGGHDPFWGVMADGPADVLKATRSQIYRGAAVIKVSATGGVYGRARGESVSDEELTFAEIRVIVDEAHKRGIAVAAHAIGLNGIRNAVQAGVDTIEHGHQLTPELAADLAARDGTLVPTLFVYRQIAEQPGIPDYAQAKAKAIVDEHRRAVRLAQEAGLRIGAGSDAGSPLTPHGALIDELLALVDAGVSPGSALRATTQDAARVLGLGHELGRVAPGFLADLVLVPENPLADLGRLRSISSVWKGGRLVFAR